MKVLVRPLFQGVKRLAFLPFLSLPIILTLGFTLGALLSITALVSTLFLKPLPGIKDDANLHTISLQVLLGNGMSLNFWDWRRSAHFEQYFTDVGDWGVLETKGSGIRTASNAYYRVTQYDTSANILKVLGAKLIKGNGTNSISPEEKIWISNTLWKEAFSSRENVIGEQLMIRNESYVIAGVIEDVLAVKSDLKIRPQQVWLVKDLNKILHKKESLSLSTQGPTVFFRSPNPNISKSNIQQWFDGYLNKNSFPTQITAEIEPQINISRYRENLLSSSNDLIIILALATLSLFVMACLNLLNLFIAHYLSRRKEFAIKQALGAKQTHLFSFTLLENLPTFIMAAVLGLLISGWAISILPQVSNNTFPLEDTLNLSGLSVVAALSIVLGLACVFSFLALVNMGTQSINQKLNSSGKGGVAQSSNRLRRGVMALQLCIASILLTGTVMLAKQSAEAVYRPLGYRLDNIYKLSWSYADKGWAKKLGQFKQYGGSEYQRLHSDVAQTIESLIAGAEVVTARPPLGVGGIRTSNLFIPSLSERIFYEVKTLSDNYFSGFNIDLLAGQAPTPEQIQANERFIVIDEKMASMVFPGLPLEQVLGRQLPIRSEKSKGDPHIIGIAANTVSRAGSFGLPDLPLVYQTPEGSGTQFELSVIMPEGISLSPSSLATSLKAQFPRLENLEVISLDDMWLQQTETQRLCLTVTITLSCLTLALSAIGVAGLTRTTASQQRYDLAVRMAMGGSVAHLLRMIFTDALWMLGIGLGLGFILAVQLYNYVKQLVRMMPEFDWGSMLLLDGCLMLIVCLAVFIPAWKLIKANPMKVLREL